jgi:hypothetical protein
MLLAGCGGSSAGPLIGGRNASNSAACTDLQDLYVRMDDASIVSQGELAALIGAMKGADSTALLGESRELSTAIGSDINAPHQISAAQRNRIYRALETTVHSCNSLGLPVTGTNHPTRPPNSL